MAFSKFEPLRAQKSNENPVALRRAKILKYASWISLVYTLIGFVFIGVFVLYGNPF